MTKKELLHHRLHNQQISQKEFVDPFDVVKWLGVVQAQDYFGALWALGLRTKNTIESDIEKALAARKFIRTWPLRGTLHFVAAEDARWMLALSKPKLIATNAGRMKKEYDLDEKVFTKSKKVLVRALERNKQIPRDDVYTLLEKAGITTVNSRGLHILWRLAMEGLICFGTRHGKQQTFTLLDEWIAPTKLLTHEESLAELAARYFNGHGPATLKDFIWWSGLSPADAKTALESVRAKFIQHKIDDQIYWMSGTPSVTKTSASTVYLLPSYDEYMVGYADRSASLDTDNPDHGHGIFKPVVVINGKVNGIWKRTLKKDAVDIDVTPFDSFSKPESKAIDTAAERYGKFIDKKRST